ncbi:unnamed protein product [Prorocentrum cordatum]|uniref:Uncharacterized protein n=1 Tax=Prorocentrum cordatum TaxID=2364126 RepID=A0ABN9X0Q3_9DINO|nr:unnamed protein product [Polarella glacialis]
MLKTTARLQAEQCGVQKHEQLMKYLEMAGTYGKLDLTTCVFAEDVFLAGLRPPSGASATALGELRAHEGAQLHAGHADICKVCHHSALPNFFRDPFASPSRWPVAWARPPWRAMLHSRRLASWPALAALAVIPMGRSHALHWCPAIHGTIDYSMPELLDAPFVSDKIFAPAASTI